jgi:tetratricopeptide (TPR) repeat protein
VPQAVVEEVHWADKPSDYRAAEIHRKRREYENAIKYYEKTLKSNIAREFWVLPYTTYYLGLCNYEMGNLDEAEKYYRRLIEEYPQARFYPHARIGLGNVHLAKGVYDQAIAQFKEVADAKDPYTDRPVFRSDLYYTARLQVVEGMIRNKEYGAATLKLGKLAAETESEFPDISLWALQKKAFVKVVSGRLEEGTAEYRAIIKNAIEQMDGSVSDKEARLSEVVAECYNGLGDAFRKHSQAEDRFKRALMEYLRVVTVLAEAASASEYAHALAGAAKCFEEIGDEERARELRTQLKARFPNYGGLD